MIKFFLSYWDGNSRRIDMAILWPSCKKYAEDLDQAKAAFYLHAKNDRAWTDYYTGEELINYVGSLQ